MLLSVATSAATALSDRHPVEIVLAGPEPGRHEMENAIRAVLGPTAEISWSTRDAPFAGASLPLPLPGGSTQLWIDVTNPAQVRIFLPACGPPGSPTLRTIDSPAHDDEVDEADKANNEGWKLVARETVAQVVRSAVQVLTGSDATDDPPRATIAAAEPETISPPRPSAEVSQRRGPTGPVQGTVDAEGKTHRGRFGAAIAAGAHTSPFLLSEPYNQSHWLGLSVQLAGRWETPALLLALRGAWETSERSIDTINLESQLFSISLALSRKLTFGALSFGIGAEIGGLFMRQVTSEIQDAFNTYSLPRIALTLPAQLATTWSTGFLLGPLAEMNLTVTEHAFVHLEVARPVAFMDIDDNGATAWKASAYLRAMGGFGVRL